LNLYQDVREVEDLAGSRKFSDHVVKVYGTVRVDDWNPESRVARARIIEALDVIERGVRVGPIGRRFDVVPPKKATKQVLARIVSSLYPNVYFGKNQIVFIDKGSDDGLRAGNRLRVFRRGDTWRRNLSDESRFATQDIRLEADESPAIERFIEIRGDDETFPDEVIGEVQILKTQKYSSVALVTKSQVELTLGDRLIATIGY
jgi:hypothetical protein